MNIKPCTAFASNSPIKQLQHIKQEFNEVMQAWNDWQFRDGGEQAKMHFAEELVDLQTTCETMMLVIGLDGLRRNELRKLVFYKNWKRNYYTEADK